jgi:hypothetical protein
MYVRARKKRIKMCIAVMAAAEIVCVLSSLTHSHRTCKILLKCIAIFLPLSLAPTFFRAFRSLKLFSMCISSSFYSLSLSCVCVCVCRLYIAVCNVVVMQIFAFCRRHFYRPSILPCVHYTHSATSHAYIVWKGRLKMRERGKNR